MTEIQNVRGLDEIIEALSRQKEVIASLQVGRNRWNGIVSLTRNPRTLKICDTGTNREEFFSIKHVTDVYSASANGETIFNPEFQTRLAA